MKYKAIKVNGKKIDEHRYIMEQHLGRKLTKNEVVHHINGNKQDNRLENLELMSRSEHSRKHAISDDAHKNFATDEAIQKRKKTMKNHISFSKPVGKFSLDGRLIEEYPSCREAGRDGFIHTHICSCCRGDRKTHKGYIWKYV